MTKYPATPASPVQTSSSVGRGRTVPSASDPGIASSRSSAALSVHEDPLS